MFTRASFGFHGAPLLKFKTDRLDLRGLDLGKSLKFQRANADYYICKRPVYKSERPKLPYCILIGDLHDGVILLRTPKCFVIQIVLLCWEQRNNCLNLPDNRINSKHSGLRSK